MRHLIKVNNQNSLLNGLDSGYIERPYVAIVSGVTAPDYNGSSATPFEQQYFTIQAKGISFIGIPTGVTYSTDRGASWISNSSVLLTDGQVAWFKGLAPTFKSSNKFTVSIGEIIVYGNSMSLLYGDSFSGQTTLPSNGALKQLFASCSGLTSAEHLILPATALTDTCYQSMFQYCSNLKVAPELPATVLSRSCYSSMFYGCTSLTTAPVLPATTLAQSCYNQMFTNCTSLIQTGDLPATTLAQGCYNSMFAGCTGLISIPYSLPATTLAQGCYSNMFQNCTSITRTPELLATTLVDTCYQRMFQNCTSLNNVTCLATDISATDCTTNWMMNVAPTGRFIKNSSMSDWTTGNNGIPSGWTVVDSE